MPSPRPFPWLFITLFSCGADCSDYGVQPTDKVEDPVPIIDVSPQVLDFGGVPLDETGSLTLTLESVGTAAVTISALQLQRGTSFTLAAPWSEITLPVGESVQVELLFAPDLSEAQDLLVLASSDPADPEVYVPVWGRGLYPLVHIYPETVDFGDIMVCQRGVQEVLVSNIGEMDLTLDDIIQSSEYIAMDLPTAMPTILAPGAQVPLTLTFSPIAEGDHFGSLWVYSDEPAGYRVQYQQGVGTWASIEEYQDEFYQPEQAYGAADILFYVDQSASMDDDKERLTAGFASFVASLDESGEDWQAMVVTDDDGCSNGGIIATGDSDASGAFQDAVWGPWGLDTESGLSLALRALTQTGRGECNADFLREDADTLLVMVSDEPEQSESSWLSLTTSILAEAPNATVVAIVGDVPMGCATAEPGEGYVDAALATDGLFLSICDENWSDHFREMQGLLTQAPTDTFVLTYVPDETTIRVFVNSVETSAWRYDSAANAVIMDVMPPYDANIAIRYALLSGCG